MDHTRTRTWTALTVLSIAATLMALREMFLTTPNPTTVFVTITVSVACAMLAEHLLCRGGDQR